MPTARNTAAKAAKTVPAPRISRVLSIGSTSSAKSSALSAGGGVRPSQISANASRNAKKSGSKRFFRSRESASSETSRLPSSESASVGDTLSATGKRSYT